LLVLLAACSAPPTHQQVTSRAVARNCEAQGAVAAEEIRKQNIQIVKEGGSVNQKDSEDVEARAEEVREQTFKSCMLKYAV
jgi:uncharacterized lipoprotein YajG